MEFKLSDNSYPSFCIEALKIEHENNDKKFSSLSVSEAKRLFKFWIYEVLKELQRPAELSKVYYSRAEVCKMLDLSPPTLDKLIKTGQIETTRLGHKIAIYKESIDKFLNR